MEDDFVDYVLDQLNMPEEMASRRMFSAHGLYHKGRFFGIVHQGVVYFKTSEKTRGEYVERGMGPFRPSKTQTLKNYYEVPLEVLEDRERLREWAVLAARLKATGSKKSF